MGSFDAACSGAQHTQTRALTLRGQSPELSRFPCASPPFKSARIAIPACKGSMLDVSHMAKASRLLCIGDARPLYSPQLLLCDWYLVAYVPFSTCRPQVRETRNLAANSKQRVSGKNAETMPNHCRISRFIKNETQISDPPYFILYINSINLKIRINRSLTNLKPPRMQMHDRSAR